MRRFNDWKLCQDQVRVAKKRRRTAFRHAQNLKQTIARKQSEKSLLKWCVKTFLKNVPRPKKLTQTWAEIARKFQAGVNEKSNHVCNCCGRLWFNSCVTAVSREFLRTFAVEEAIIEQAFYVQKNLKTAEFCQTCLHAIKRNEVPKLCLLNGLDFPKISKKLIELNRLEERLVSPRHIFQSIWTVMGPKGQYKTKGGIVNVPVDVDTTVSMLPRPLDDSNIIHVRLARKMEYVKDYMSFNVRPMMVYNAARSLTRKPLYIEHGIFLNESWSVIDAMDQLEMLKTESFVCDTVEEAQPSPISEKELETAGETLLSSDVGIRIAPAQGYVPASILFDADAEYLAFPKIFGGHKLRPIFQGKEISYADIAKSMATRYDRRVTQRHDYLLFIAKKLELLKLSSNIKICLRKGFKRDGTNITASDLLNDGVVEGLVKHDDGYKVLNGVRSSAEHWRQEKLKLLAMIRQFGLPTFFLTLSAAETKWSDLLVQLKLTVDHTEVSREEAEILPYEEKARLIQNDPVTCALHFDKRLKEIKKTWKPPNGPFNKYELTHFYHRIEFQHRGSPHAHMLLWFDRAPLMDGSSSRKDIIDFIDSIITCSVTEVLDENLITYQTHHHTRTCFKRQGQECRFGAPFPPMDKTRILDTLPDTFDKKYRMKLHRIYDFVKLILEEEELCGTFEEFLHYLKISKLTYFLAIRSKLKRSKVFLRRKPSEVLINPYCAKILNLFKANMDIQYIIDPFGCASYIIDYINKADRGLSLMLQKAVDEIRQGNSSLKDSFKKISNIHYNNSEMSVQEACWNILQLHMSECSEKCVFIPTYPATKRVRMVRSKNSLAQCDPDSTNVFVDGLIEHYTHRPGELEDECLADFAANYDFSYQSSSNALKLKNQKGYLTKRKKPSTIRYKICEKMIDASEHYRQINMLFLPWKNEQRDLLQNNNQNTYKENLTLVKTNEMKYNKLSTREIEEAIADASANDFNYDSEDANTSCEQHFEFDDFTLEYDIDVSSQMKNYLSIPTAHYFHTPGKCPEDQYIPMISKLNEEQIQYLSHFQDNITKEKSQFFHFITGQAGVGKTHLIKTIYQTAIRYFNADPESNPDQPSVLLCSATGKAAHNINGETLHHAFMLPLNQNNLQTLSADVANTLACKLSQLKLLVIDEVSLVGQKMFQWIDQRLRCLFSPDKPFGGISVITCGDFKQLQPVFSTPLFSPKRNDVYNELFGFNLWHLFKVFQLTKVMRQKEANFITALNNMAKGEMTLEDIQLIQSRETSIVPGFDTVHLFYANDHVDDYNSDALESMPGQSFHSPASDIVVGDGSDMERQQIKFTVSKSKRSENKGIPDKLTLKLNGRYMLVYNINTSDGLVNGACGTLMKIDFGINKDRTNSSRKPLRLWIKFDDPKTGSLLRRTRQNLIENLKYPSDWTPIDPQTFTIKTRRSGNLQVLRKQFPLVPAHAITIHKSQGQTYSSVCVHITPGMHRELLYVACSRATTLTGLYIIGKFKPPNPPGPRNALLLEESRWDSVRLIPRFLFLTQPAPQIQLIYKNIQSIQKHFSLVAADPVYKSSQVLFLAETWALKSDMYNLQDKTLLIRESDSKFVRKPEGVWVYVADTLLPHIRNNGSFTIREHKHFVNVAYLEIRNLIIFALYVNPKCPLALLKLAAIRIKSLKASYIVVMGDMNKDANDFSNKMALQHVFDFYDMKFLNSTKSTTKYNSLLDVIFSNVQMTNGTYTSFASYHYPLWIRL